MDKYFDPAYDPALDYTPITDSNSSFVPEGNFEGWDAMLQLMRQRREDKEDKKRMESLGLNSKKGKGKELLSGLGMEKEPDVMQVVYKKRGAVREWDLGKD